MKKIILLIFLFNIGCNNIFNFKEKEGSEYDSGRQGDASISGDAQEDPNAPMCG